MQAQPAGFNPPAFMRRHMAAGDSMGSDASYNERRLLWEVGTLCLGCILRKDSSARQGGRGCRLSLPHLPHARRAGFLWEAVCFVQAVTGVRIVPPIRAEEGAGSACRAGQPAFMPRPANTAGAEVSMGSRYVL